ncbi:MAG TPA: hypothetical protein PLU72_13165 [Candidatus Ozemobacteraceae bacterium]|nr:hypothetical protein [Candidatus Ozemobacteraceae bacterium]HQG28571.1 hypothetical protein [Candidatus Ozemobacteraceae bacterium]
MSGISKNARRGGVILLVVIGILMIATWVSLDHTGRLLKLVSFQRETMQRLRSSDVPARSEVQPPCKASRPKSYHAEQASGTE